MKRKFVLTLAMILCAALIMQPYQGQAASKLDKINKQIKELQREIDRQAQLKKNAESNVKVLTNKKEVTKEEIDQLSNEIDQVGMKLAETEDQIAEAEDRLKQTQKELQDAIKQEEATNDALASRIRLMYMNGSVSYLDVVLSTTNFQDFLTRFDDMQFVTVQTRSLLEDKKAAREQVQEKEAQQTKDQLERKLLQQQEADQKDELESKQNAKEAMVAKLSAQIDDFGEISEESQKELMALAQKMAKLQAEKNRIKTYYTGGKLAFPLKSSYRFSSPFGYRVHPITGVRKLHSGMDFAAPQGTPIYAAESGVVIVAQWWSGYGNCIIIDHGGGLWTLYGHIKNGGILVKKGETVKRGEKIALIGSTGQSTGPHLHFEVRKNSEPVNPEPYLK